MAEGEQRHPRRREGEESSEESTVHPPTHAAPKWTTADRNHRDVLSSVSLGPQWAGTANAMTDDETWVSDERPTDPTHLETIREAGLWTLSPVSVLAGW